jgi:hypothetical protein
MQSLIIATTNMDLVAGRHNCADVTGMIGLRKQSLRAPRFYARPVSPASTCLSGSTLCHGPERQPASSRPGRACSVKRESHWRMLRPCGSRRPVAIG